MLKTLQTTSVFARMIIPFLLNLALVVLQILIMWLFKVYLVMVKPFANAILIIFGTMKA